MSIYISNPRTFLYIIHQILALFSGSSSRYVPCCDANTPSLLYITLVSIVDFIDASLIRPVQINCCNLLQPTHTQTRIHTYTHKHTHSHAHTHTHTYTRTHMHTYTHTNKHTHTRTHTRIHTHTFAHTCMHIIKPIHTHTPFSCISHKYRSLTTLLLL